MTRRRVLLLSAAILVLVLVLVVRPWPGTPKNRVTARPDGGGPGWDVYLAGAATREEGERLGRYFLARATPTGGRGGVVVLERPPAGGVVAALLLSPDEVLASTTMGQAGRLRDELALQVCQGPMRLGQGDVPVRDVVVTLR